MISYKHGDKEKKKLIIIITSQDRTERDGEGEMISIWLRGRQIVSRARSGYSSEALKQICPSTAALSSSALCK